MAWESIPVRPWIPIQSLVSAVIFLYLIPFRKLGKVLEHFEYTVYILNTVNFRRSTRSTRNERSKETKYGHFNSSGTSSRCLTSIVPICVTDVPCTQLCITYSYTFSALSPFRTAFIHINWVIFLFCLFVWWNCKLARNAFWKIAIENKINAILGFVLLSPIFLIFHLKFAADRENVVHI